MDWLDQDKRHVWHPFTQEKTAPAPLLIEKAQGAYLYTADGEAIFDAISSWWVNLHGHCHPHIVSRVQAQLEQLEQVIFAGVTHPLAIELAARIVQLLPSRLQRVFYSDNGSTAVEVALKIALQYWFNRGQPRQYILALRHSYHGDTFGAMAVGERSPFSQAFWPYLFPVLFIDPPTRGAKAAEARQQLQAVLAEHPQNIAAMIYEPLVQGAGGMLMQEAEVLDAMLAQAKQAGVLCIADEVMTGFGRTGRLFASAYLEQQPDILCLAKGLTGGTLPLSMTVCSEEVYDAFWSDDRAKAFFHGHSFTANSLGCAAALASLDLIVQDDFQAAIDRISRSHHDFSQELAKSSLRSVFRDIRQQGSILALELAGGGATGYFNQLRDRMAAYFLQQKVLLRPLGNVVYILPPFCSSQSDLSKAYQAITTFAESIR